MNYTQLTEVQRYQISILLKNGFSQRSIAKEIGVSPSTVNREISRNKGFRGRSAQPNRPRRRGWIHHPAASSEGHGRGIDPERCRR